MSEAYNTYIEISGKEEKIRLRKSLFWDVPTNSLDLDKNKRLILERVFTRGNIEEFQSVNGYYSREEIREMVKQIGQLDKKKLHFISRKYQIKPDDYVERLLNNYKTKYTQRNVLHALKSLTYFEDVDVNDWPELLKRKNTSWDEVQNTLGRACDEYIRKITCFNSLAIVYQTRFHNEKKAPFIADHGSIHNGL